MKIFKVVKQPQTGTKHFVSKQYTWSNDWIPQGDVNCLIGTCYKLKQQLNISSWVMVYQSVVENVH